MNPLVSIIIPTRNRKEYFEKAVKSVLAQSYENIEIIAIDDGSTDGTPDVFSKFANDNFRFIFQRNETNLGFVESLNKGMKLAKGKYISRIDDDDIWLDKKKLKKQVDYLESNPECALCGGGVIKIDEKGREITRFLLPETDEEIRKSILISNVFAHSSVVFRKEMCKNGYDKRFGFFSDWALWLELGKSGKFYNFQEFFTYYLDRDQLKTGNSHDVLIRRRLLTNIKLKSEYKKYYKGYPAAVFICFANYIYSFLPLRKKIWPLLFWARNLVLGPSPYKYYNGDKKV
jgi:glycosyltransferase involved in cell wall biosynthesis